MNYFLKVQLPFASDPEITTWNSKTPYTSKQSDLGNCESTAPNTMAYLEINFAILNRVEILCVKLKCTKIPPPNNQKTHQK